MNILLITLYDPNDLGIRYIASHLTQKGHLVQSINLKVLHAPVVVNRPTKDEVDKAGLCLNGSLIPNGLLGTSPISDDEFHLLGEKIAEINPDLVGIGTRSKNHHLLPGIVKIIRANAPNAIIIAGGAGPTLDPEEPLNAGVDMIIRGEGEYAINDLLSALEEKKDWRKGHNLAWLENGRMLTTPLYPLEKNLDVFTTRYFDPKKHWLIEDNQIFNFASPHVPQGINSHLLYFLATRGCPADCSYCTGRRIRNVYKQQNLVAPRMRQTSLENVLRELEGLIDRKNTHRIHFCDEYFIYPDAKLLNFFNEYKRRINIPFTIRLSMDQLANNPELFEAAYEAGLAELWCGLQSGSEEFCKKIYNRKNTNSNIAKVINQWSNKGLNTIIYMIAGNPLEDWRYIKETYEFLDKLPKFDPSFKSLIKLCTTKLYIAPGTDLEHTFKNVTANCSSSEFYYQAMMMQFKLLIDEYDFKEISQDTNYKQNPNLLGSLYHDTIRNKHTEYLKKHIAELTGQKAIFWGVGTVYRQKYDKLATYITPVSTVIDDRFRITQLYNNEVLSPDEAMAKYGANIPIIAFGQTSNLSSMHRSIQQAGFTGPIISCSELAEI